MRNVIAFVVALGVVVAIFWFTREAPSKKSSPKAGSAVASGSVATPSGSAPASTPRPAKIDKVRRLDPAARKALGEQIAAARREARAKATAAGQPTSEDTMKLEDVAPDLETALEASIPILASCYEGTDVHAALAAMTMVSDPELGTVIDTDEIKDEHGKPLAAALDTCLRDAIDTLALPPLGPTGGTLQLQYTFKLE